MRQHEVGTLSALKAIRRELADPTIASHHGRVVKTTGDGILIEFASVVDAVTCAIAIQRGMVNRNAAIPEDKLRMERDAADALAWIAARSAREGAAVIPLPGQDAWPKRCCGCVAPRSIRRRSMP